MSVQYALSLKQPWAALVVHGLKTIEIRRWTTRRRGRILIHAARIPDDRDYGWSLVPPEAKETAELGGGIIGAVELTECISYRSAEQFAADQQQHLNAPDWFRPPCMYGFRLRHPETLSFRRFSGNVKFFTVPVAADA
jgi:hypothetical protein